MNTRTMFFRLAGISLVAVASSALAIACSGDDNNGNPAPTQNDSGTGSDVTMTGDDSSMGTDTSTSTDSGTGMDVVIISTDGCVSEASTCNTCYTSTQAAQDPYNACTPYTVNCTPFDNKSRIMGLAADGGIPAVP
jgi:hypothetical protein